MHLCKNRGLMWNVTSKAGRGRGGCDGSDYLELLRVLTLRVHSNLIVQGQHGKPITPRKRQVQGVWFKSSSRSVEVALGPSHHAPLTASFTIPCEGLLSNPRRKSSTRRHRRVAGTYCWPPGPTWPSFCSSLLHLLLATSRPSCVCLWAENTSGSHHQLLGV